MAVSAELLEWCRNGGVRWHGIEAGFVVEGWRGVLATQALPPGTCVLRVPRRLLMSVESARRDAELAAALQQCAASGAALTSEQILAAHLLHEASKGPASFWHPYLRSLPPRYTTLMCFSKEEAAALQAPHATAAARAAAAGAAAQDAGALPLLRALRLAPKWRSRAAWLWAASTLSSRTMYLPGDPAGALTPFGDLHNYRPPPPPFTPTQEGLLAAARALAAALAAQTSEAAAPTAVAREVNASAAAAGSTAAAEVSASAPAAGSTAAIGTSTAGGAASEGELAGDGSLDEAADEYCIYARTRYAPGDQVFLCYGRNTNLELLQHYGFVLAGNPHDTAPLPAHLLPPAVRQQLAGEGGGGGSGSWGDLGSEAGEGEEHALLPEAYLHAHGAPSWGLLCALRLACAAPAERKAGACRALEGQPVSAASERAAFAALLAACEAALAALPSSIKEDEQQLAQLHKATAVRPADAQQGPAPAQDVQQQGAQQEQLSTQQAQQQAQWAAEKLAVSIEWRLCYKRTLQRGKDLCQAVLAALPPAGGCPAGITAPADISQRLAALQRKPRW
ncbi:hypothetical protein ABPG75_013743 [Micractinium tetrahymenae]